MIIPYHTVASDEGGRGSYLYLAQCPGVEA
jgi:hypothetical protein